MAHGGARARSGPPPDPNALRRDRPADAAGWITLPSERTGPPPEWPLPTPPSPEEVDQWAKLWRTPQAVMWEAEGSEDDVALYVRNFVLAAIPGAPVGLTKEVRIMRDDLGLSPGSALRKRWRIASDSTPPAATATTKTPAARSPRGPSSRDRFRVVQPVPDEAEEE